MTTATLRASTRTSVGISTGRIYRLSMVTRPCCMDEVRAVLNANRNRLITASQVRKLCPTPWTIQQISRSLCTLHGRGDLVRSNKRRETKVCRKQVRAYMLAV